MHERLKRLYDEGKLDEQDIRSAVVKGWISEDEAGDILTPKEEEVVEVKGEELDL